VLLDGITLIVYVDNFIL